MHFDKKYRDHNSSYSSQHSSNSEYDCFPEETHQAQRKINLAPCRLILKEILKENQFINDTQLQSLSDVEEQPSDEHLERSLDKEIDDLMSFIDNEYDKNIQTSDKRSSNKNTEVFKATNTFDDYIELFLFNSNIYLKIGIKKNIADSIKTVFHILKIFGTILVITYILLNYIILPFIFQFLL